MKSCKGRVLALIAVGLAGVAAAADKEPVSRTETLELTAKVESVDQATRTLVLTGESGARAYVVAGPDVRNLNQVKAGDRIRLTYVIGVAAELKPRGTPASAPVEVLTEERSAPGKTPSATVAQGVVTTVKIDSVDTSFNTVTFKRSDGITRTIGVDSADGQRFIRTLKPGDSVEITYKEAMALRLEPIAAR